MACSVWWRAWSWKFCYPDAMKGCGKPLALGLSQEWDLAVRLVGPSISAQTGSIRGQSSGQQLLLRGMAYNKDGRSLLLLWQQSTQFLWVNENQHCSDTWGFVLSMEAQGIWRVHSKWLLSLDIFSTTYNQHKIIIILIIMNFITINIFMTLDSFAKDFFKSLWCRYLPSPFKDVRTEAPTSPRSHRWSMVSLRFKFCQMSTITVFSYTRTAWTPGNLIFTKDGFPFQKVLLPGKSGGFV